MSQSLMKYYSSLLCINRFNPLLAVCAVISQLWCIRSWFCWLRSWGEAAVFWVGFLAQPFESTRGPAVAAACVCPACPCHGTQYKFTLFLPVWYVMIKLTGHSIYFFYIPSVLTLYCLMNAWSPNKLLFLFQATVILDEGGRSSVCDPKNGALSPLRSVMDKRQLWSFGCKH